MVPDVDIIPDLIAIIGPYNQVGCAVAPMIIKVGSVDDLNTIVPDRQGPIAKRQRNIMEFIRGNTFSNRDEMVIIIHAKLEGKITIVQIDADVAIAGTGAVF